jgi:hypothetical protein
MSADHASFGPGGSTSRPSKFPATGRRWLESVVRTDRRGALALIPWARMSLAAVFPEQACPRAFHSGVIRGLPYRPRTSAWTSSMAPTSSGRRCSVGRSGRAAQA